MSGGPFASATGPPAANLSRSCRRGPEPGGSHPEAVLSTLNAGRASETLIIRMPKPHLRDANLLIGHPSRLGEQEDRMSIVSPIRRDGDGFQVDAALVAPRFGLSIEAFRDELHGGSIVTVCTRLTFRRGALLWRFVLNPDGTIVEDPILATLTSSPRPRLVPGSS
jgi:hypothetical protein